MSHDARSDPAGRPKSEVLMEFRQRIRPFVLPFAIVFGLLFHGQCRILKSFVPALVFCILLLNFVAADVKKMRFKRMYVWLMLFQTGVSVGGYALLTFLHAGPIIAQGVLIGVLCPVAASVVVISCMLGADRETVTTFTIIDNLFLALFIPLLFSFVGNRQSMPFLPSFLLILSKVGAAIGLPFFMALLFQRLTPRFNGFLCRHTGFSFYLWALALSITLGRTIDFIILHGKGNGRPILALAAVSVVFCILQFGIGKQIGRKYGDTIAGGQLLGQKNTAMGLWIANTYLNPLSSVYLAFYCIWQNLFNSWQLWRHDKATAEKMQVRMTMSAPKRQNMGSGKPPADFSIRPVSQTAVGIGGNA